MVVQDHPTIATMAYVAHSAALTLLNGRSIASPLQIARRRLVWYVTEWIVVGLFPNPVPHGVHDGAASVDRLGMIRCQSHRVIEAKHMADFMEANLPVPNPFAHSGCVGRDLDDPTDDMVRRQHLALIRERLTYNVEWK